MKSLTMAMNKGKALPSTHVRALVGALLVCGLFSQSALAQVSTRQVSLPNQDYTESTQDLVVKVMGGYVTINRTWTYGKWYLNDAWSDLVLVPDPMDGVLAVSRADRVYTRASGVDGAVFTLDENNLIKSTETGWQWYDRMGNTIDYDKSGKMLGYADRNGVKVSMVRDANGRLTGIKDHFDRQVITIENDPAGFPKTVSDYSGRTVKYEWQSQTDVRGGGLKGLLSKVTDARGNPWTYTYTNGYIETRTDPEGGKIKLTYLGFPNDNAGMTGILASAGSSGSSSGGISLDLTRGTGSTKVSQPKTARVASFTDEVGSTTNYRIDYNRISREYMVSMQLPNGGNQVTRYDSRGRVLQNTLGDLDLTAVEVLDANTERTKDARGLVTTTVYNAARLPLKVVYPDGASESTTYDPIYNQKTSFTNALGVVSTWSYDAKGNLTEWVEAKGLPEQRTTRYTHDEWGNLLTRTRGAGDGRQGDAIMEKFDYDNAGNLTKTTNGEGHSTTFPEHNAQGLALKRINALAHATTFAYDAAGNLRSTTNALGHKTLMAYDGRGRRSQTTSAEGRVTTIFYDKAGRVEEVLAPGQARGQGTRTQYDVVGNVKELISPSGATLKFEYDTQFRLVTTTDPAGNSTTYEYGPKGTHLAGLITTATSPTYRETYQYDQRNRRTAIEQHLNASTVLTTRHAFDAMGQQVSSTDAAGKTSLLTYDGLGRLTQSTDPMAQVTKQTWNAFDQLTSLTDAKGNTHRFEYDKAGQMRREVRPMGGETRFAYDTAGQPILRTDAGGNTRAYSHDAAGLLKREEHKLGGSALDQVVTYAHNKDGVLTSYEQKDGGGGLISSASYTLDAQGRTETSAIRYGSVTGGSEVRFEIAQRFNADGQLAAHTYPDGSVGQYSYQHGLLGKITLPNGSDVQYGDYKWMLPQEIRTPGATKRVSYDSLLRMSGMEVKGASAQVLASLAYQYDAAGNISQIDSDLGKTSYGYDLLDRLTQANPDQSLQALSLPVENYSYDALGNRTSSAYQAGTWDYNQDNQLTEFPYVKPFSGQSPQATQVSYTPQGHTAKEVNALHTRDYGYNAAERLTRFANTAQGESSPNLQASYRYDPFGRRIAKQVNKSGNVDTTYFLYSETGLMGEANAQGQLTKAYAFNPVAAQKELWSTDPLWQAEVKNGSLIDSQTAFHYLHTDHLGTPVLATNASGQSSWKGTSEAFGATGVLQGQSSITMNLRFPGQYFDSETGMHFNFHRDYRPNTGRYVQADPIGLVGGVNLFLYANINPILLIDSKGLQSHAQCANPVNAPACAAAGLPIRVIPPPIYYPPDCDKNCKKAILDASNLWWDLTSKRIPQYVPDSPSGPTHLTTIKQKQESLKDAIARVKRYCGTHPMLPEWERVANLNI